jgi:vesicle coat complex subunit
MEERDQAKQLRMLAHNIKAQEHKQTQKSQEAIVKAEAVTALAKIHGERYAAHAHRYALQYISWVDAMLNH